MGRLRSRLRYLWREGTGTVVRFGRRQTSGIFCERLQIPLCYISMCVCVFLLVVVSHGNPRCVCVGVCQDVELVLRLI